MTKDEALQLALEAMEEIIHWYAVRDRNDVFLNFVDQNPEIQKIMKSITAIKEALETKEGLLDRKSYLLGLLDQKSRLELETKDEPVAWGMEKDGVILDVICPAEHEREEGEYTIPLYTTPQRTWVGLTDEEIYQGLLRSPYALQNAGAWREGVTWAEEILKRKNYE